MLHRLFFLLKKDFQLMLSSRFLLLALGSLVLYSCYINLIYVKLDQSIYPVYLYDPQNTQHNYSEYVTPVETLADLMEGCADAYSVGIDVSGQEPEIYMLSSGVDTIDNYRASWAASALTADINNSPAADVVGTNSKHMKNRREITAEFLFFELTAVGFLGIASMLFKEKQMGVIRVHGILPLNKAAFICSKLFLFLLSDLIFASLLTLINLGVSNGLHVLPAVLVQAGILSIIMALIGFFCAVLLPGFKQFSLLYLILAVFVTTPVFLAGQTGITWSWMSYHPMYYLFGAMKTAYFDAPIISPVYYLFCGTAIFMFFLLARKILIREMTKEG